jgi:uncharacterized protein YbjT (DUF2867 family)
MKVLIAGATGAIGRQLVPILTEAGHEVTALSRSPRRAGPLEALGVRVTVADALDADDCARPS